MSGPFRVELEASRVDSDPRPLVLTAASDTTAGEALDVLGEALGLTNAAGAVQARSLISGRWVERTARLCDIGLLRGERLSLVVGLQPGGATGPLHRWPEGRPGDDSARVAVNRPPRAVEREPELSIAVPRERQHRPPRRFPLGAMMIPLGIGLLLVVVTRRIEIALFSLFTPVMVLWNYVEERRARADEMREYGRTYADEVAATLARVRETTDAWAGWLHRHYPAPDQVSEIARTLSHRLWERQPGDPDFLRLRLGVASRRAPVTLRQDESARIVTRDDEPDFEAAARAERLPSVVDVVEGPLAILGAAQPVERSVAWLVAQVVTLHSPAHVMVAGAFSDSDTCDWFRWLPHVAHGWLPTSPVADNARAADALLRAAARVGAQRRALREQRGGLIGEPFLVLFVDGRLGLDPAALAAAAACHDVGIAVVWFGTDLRAVPTASAHLVTLDADGGGAELVAHRGGARDRFVPDDFRRTAALDMSAALAPVRDASDVRRMRSVPDHVRLEELVSDLVSPAAMRQRWQNAPLHQLTARLGMGADGVVDLDLGPSGSHVLVGGTTGSGKSELLQTMVTSLAAEYPPSRVGFLLVDYKGGAAFKDAMDLPHCVGVVTDLDEHLTRRVILALDAEIKRREELLAHHGARDLTELRRVSPEHAPADLVIVVDEFAALAKEIPEFVEGVVDIAARGRSLGLRLVLATQRPAGVVNDRIRANVGVRIALRVNDEADSTDVIDDRRAAHIARSRPGRAYIKVHRDLAEFQSAFVGAMVRSSTGSGLEARDLWATEASPLTPSGSGPTVLEAVVDSARKVMQLGRWEPPHVPWLPAMPRLVTTGSLIERTGRLREGAVPLALADLPAQQAQRVVAFDLEQHRSMLVFGTSRSGKTTVLRTIAAGLIATLDPDRIEIHALDFAGHGLHVLADAPQVAVVTGGDEPGRVVRVLRRLGAELEQRKRALAAAGVTGFAALADGTHRLPRILVLLDSYAGASAALERLEGGRVLERLERLVVDGPTVGIHFVITADRRAAVPTALTSVVTTRLVLRMAERDDYSLLGVDTAVSRDARMEPGRGFIHGDTEVQVAVRASSDPAEEQHALLALIAETTARWPHRVPPVLSMPGQVWLADLPAAERALHVPVGIGEATVAPVALDLTDSHALIAGPPRSGRSTTLATVAAGVAAADPAAFLVLVAGRLSPALTSVAWSTAQVDPGRQPDLDAALAEIDQELREGRTVVVLVDDAEGLSDAASAALEGLARRARDASVRIVAATDTRWALRAYGGLVPELRRAKQGVLLAPEIEMDGDLLGVRLRPSVEPMTGAGRGYLVRHGTSELVQVAQPEGN